MDPALLAEEMEAPIWCGPMGIDRYRAGLSSLDKS